MSLAQKHEMKVTLNPKFLQNHKIEELQNMRPSKYCLITVPWFHAIIILNYFKEIHEGSLSEGKDQVPREERPGTQKMIW